MTTKTSNLNKNDKITKHITLKYTCTSEPYSSRLYPVGDQWQTDGRLCACVKLACVMKVVVT